jgi:hypothetical protein
MRALESLLGLSTSPSVSEGGAASHAAHVHVEGDARENEDEDLLARVHMSLHSKPGAHSAQREMALLRSDPSIRSEADLVSKAESMREQHHEAHRHGHRLHKHRAGETLESGTEVMLDSAREAAVDAAHAQDPIVKPDSCADVNIVAGSFPILANMDAHPTDADEKCIRSGMPKYALPLSRAAAPVAASVVPSEAGLVRVHHPDARTVVVATQDFTIKLINSDMFINQEVEYHGLAALRAFDVPAGTQLTDHVPASIGLSDDQIIARGIQVPHGLLGATWRSATYKNPWKAVPGHVEDYVVSDAFSTDCRFNRFTPDGVRTTTKTALRHDHAHSTNDD